MRVKLVLNLSIQPNLTLKEFYKLLIYCPNMSTYITMSSTSQKSLIPGSRGKDQYDIISVEPWSDRLPSGNHRLAVGSLPFDLPEMDIRTILVSSMGSCRRDFLHLFCGGSSFEIYYHIWDLCSLKLFVVL